jgi:hypothetical protein
MSSDSVQAFASLVLVALSLMSCMGQPTPQVQASLSRTASYEQQVEEGFGHLDQLPRNSSPVAH